MNENSNTAPVSHSIERAGVSKTIGISKYTDIRTYDQYSLPMAKLPISTLPFYADRPYMRQCITAGLATRTLSVCPGFTRRLFWISLAFLSS